MNAQPSPLTLDLFAVTPPEHLAAMLEEGLTLLFPGTSKRALLGNDAAIEQLRRYLYMRLQREAAQSPLPFRDVPDAQWFLMNPNAWTNTPAPEANRADQGPRRRPFGRAFQELDL